MIVIEMKCDWNYEFNVIAFACWQLNNITCQNSNRIKLWFDITHVIKASKFTTSYKFMFSIFNIARRIFVFTKKIHQKRLNCW